jgi:drug/metabolite transporter (DMT)-like permease
MNYIAMFVSIILGAIAQILMKFGTLKTSSILSMFVNVYIISGILLYGLSALFWIYAISKIQLSYAYPMVSLGYVIVFVLSYFIFNEPINVLRVSGLIAIIIGVLMIAKS